VKRTSLQASGLFDLTGSTDADLGMRLALAGALVLYVPSVRIVHHRDDRGRYRCPPGHLIEQPNEPHPANLPATTQLYLGCGIGARVRAPILLGLISASTTAAELVLWQRPLSAQLLLTIRRRLHRQILASLDPDIPRLDEA
jgi:hypothetical protein